MEEDKHSDGTPLPPSAEKRRESPDSSPEPESKKAKIPSKTFSMNFKAKTADTSKRLMIAKPISMKLGTQKDSLPKVSKSVAKAFGTSDSEEEQGEEMPAEAKRRMRNIGRETPTSAGPNSFGKTKQGFLNAHKVFEKELKSLQEAVGKEN